MNPNPIIKDRAEFISTDEEFLDSIFSPVLKDNLGDIEFRATIFFLFSKNSG